MAEQKKQNIRMIYKIGGFLAFLMLGYLGIRGYKDSVEKLKIKGCSDEIRELLMNIQDRFRGAHDYGTLDYKQASSLKLFPKRMMKQGYSEPINSYNGGGDIYYFTCITISTSLTKNWACVICVFRRGRRFASSFI